MGMHPMHDRIPMAFKVIANLGQIIIRFFKVAGR
jgi:hypothetical protein